MLLVIEVRTMAFGRMKRFLVFYGVNHKYLGLNQLACKKKNKLLRWYGFSVAESSRIVGPVDIDGELRVGNDTFIGKCFSIYGNGIVDIGDRCDIAPEVTFLTGTHEIGSCMRRAGKGKCLTTTVGNGTWIGGRSTILPGVTIGEGCVIAAGSMVTQDIPDNVLVAGVPAKIKRKLD
jgi:maltose O-acetyltransferase